MSVVHGGTFHIGRGSVHVWTAWLDVAEEAVRCLWGVLSDDERGRAARFVRSEDQRKFVVARGTLRRLLGLYLGRNPAEIRLGYSERGKPLVEDSAGTTFNLSHSGELALYAIASGRRVGIDVEKTRPGADLDSVARQLFSPSEWAVLQTLEGPRRQEALLECWVRKEAYVKGRGDGLYFGLERFAVTVKPEDPARLLTVDEPGEAERWRLRALVPAAGYTAALAVEGSDWQLATWTWTPQDHTPSACSDHGGRDRRLAPGRPDPHRLRQPGAPAAEAGPGQGVRKDEAVRTARTMAVSSALVIAAPLLFWAFRSPTRSKADAFLYGNGRSEATEVQVSPEWSGRVLESRLVEGAPVTAGDLLVRLDSTELDVRIAQLRAEEEAQRRAAARAAEQLGLWRHHAETATRELERFRNLQASGGRAPGAGAQDPARQGDSFRSRSSGRSGSWMPLEAMPTVGEVLTRMSPLRYYSDFTYGLFIRGAGLRLLWRELAILAAFGAVLFTLATLRFRAWVAAARQ